MAKILGSQKISQEIAKIAETTNGYIINGHYYNKQTMTPKPLELFETFGSPNYLQTAQNAVIRDIGVNNAANKMKEKWTFKPMVVIDKENPKISYSFICNVNKTAASDEMTAIKVIENEDGTVEQIGSYHTGANVYDSYTQYLQPINILAQNSTWVVLLCSHYYSSGSYSYFGKYIIGFNKKNGTFTKFESLYSSGQSNYMVSPLIESEIDFYYLYSYNNNGVNEIRKFDYNTLTSSVIKSIETTNKPTGVFIDTLYKTENGKSYFYYPSLTESEVKINKITLDPSQPNISDKVIVAPVAVVYNTNTTSIPSYNERGIIYHSFITELLGTKFLNIAIYGRYGDAITQTQNGIYTFRIMQDDSLVVQNFTKISNGSPKGLLLSKDKQFAICGTEQNALIFSFDMSTSGYKLMDIIDLQPYSIGLDLEDNIWLIDGNGNLHTFSNKVPTTVNIAFEKNGYSYEGTEIDSNITLEAKNYQGNRVACQLELTIKGNAVFSSNNAKTVIESTSVSALKTLPIKIQGSGNISIYPKLVLN